MIGFAVGYIALRYAALKDKIKKMKESSFLLTMIIMLPWK